MSKQYVFSSIIAGFLIGLGVIINALSTVPFLGALLFSFGLMTIIQLKLPLFTGKIGFLQDKWLPIMLLGNLIGCAAAALLYILAFPTFATTLAAVGAAKFTKNIISMIVCGFFCGTLIHFAVLSKNQVLTSLAVIIFILIGAEHCIAAFPFLIFSFNWLNLLKFFGIVMGNSLGAICINRMINRKAGQNK